MIRIAKRINKITNKEEYRIEKWIRGSIHNFSFLFGFAWFNLGYTRFEIINNHKIEVRNGMLHIFFLFWSKYILIEWDVKT